MIAYSYNIDFVSEPSLNDDDNDPLLETVRFVQAKEPLDRTALKYCSEYEKRADIREVRYCAEREFTQCLDRGCTWSLEIQPVVTFVWQMESLTVTYEPHTLFTAPLLEFWALYLLFSLKITLEDKYDIFHGAGIEVEGECIAFNANCYGGKSTLTDYFVQQGYPVFADDILPIYHQDNTYFALSSYPYIRPNRQKESLGYRVHNVPGAAKPLRRIYLLEKAQADAPVTIEKVTGLDRFRTFHYRAKNQFEFLGPHLLKKHCKMALDIPIYRITLPWDKSRLEEIKQAILEAHSKSV